MPSLPPVFSHRSSALSANLVDRSSRPSREHSKALPDLPTAGEFVSGSNRAEVEHGRGLTGTRCAQREFFAFLTMLPGWFGKADSNAKYALQAEILDGYVAESEGVPRG